MKYATLGSTGLAVSKLCFGSTILGDGREPFRSISSVGQTRADELVAMSIDSGINFLIQRRMTRRARTKSFSGNH
jgi:aryl-alcohol dehydrogenase-like predicted oxidoreductase